MNRDRNPLSQAEIDHFSLIAQGHAAFQLLWSGSELGLFDYLEEHPDATDSDLMAATGLAPYPLRILMTGLCALRLVERHEGRFRNSAIAATLLVRSRPSNLVDVLGWQRHIVYPGLTDFVDALRSGRNLGLERFPGNEPTLYQRLTHDKALETVFQNAMSSLSSHANAAMLDRLDLSGCAHLLDVGGGDGTNAMALARRFPDLRATVFDSESVCTHARDKIAQAGLSDRVDVCAGDLFDTPFPQGVDCILFCHMFTIFSPEQNQQIIQKSYDALPGGGRLIIFNMMGNDDDTGPVSTALGSPYFLAIATGRGMLYSWADYEHWLRSSGFVGFERIEGLPLDHGVFIATKG